MNDQDLGRFSEIMLGLAENFSSQISEPGLVMRFEALKEYGINEIAAAATKIVKTRTIMGMPTVAEFISAMGASEPSSPDKAAVQVSNILQQVRNVGSWGSPVYSDPITKRLMTSRWSWPSVCAMTEDEHKWWSKEFIEAYQATEKLDPQTTLDSGTSPRLKLLAGGIGKRG